MVIVFCFISAIFIHSTNCYPYTAKTINDQLSEIKRDLVKQEAKIESMMLNLVDFINVTNVNLATKKKLIMPRQQMFIDNLTISLEFYTKNLTELATLDNYWPYNNISSCKDANRKTTEIDFDLRQFSDMMMRINMNITRLRNSFNWVSLYYSLAYPTLICCYKNGTEQQQRLAAIVSTSQDIIVEFFNHINMLAQATFNETYINYYLTSFKQQLCECGMKLNENTSSKLSLIEKNVEAVEKPLVELQTAVLIAAKDALNQVLIVDKLLNATRLKLLAINVDSTKIFLTNLVTANDYKNITWNAINFCNDLYTRIGFVWFKYYYYIQTLEACNYNKTWTVKYRANLNATLDSSLLDLKQLFETRKLIGAMKILEPLMSNYSSLLTISVVKMEQIWVDSKILGDDQCSCTDVNVKNSFVRNQTSEFCF